MIELRSTLRTDPRLKAIMARHYSQPKGFVGRTLAYAVLVDGDYYGHTIAGSATRYLPGRNEFFGDSFDLHSIISNTFFHVEKIEGHYPCRNFTTRVIETWMERASRDWLRDYGGPIVGFETLIELPRTGECYRRAGWTCVGQTKGMTCKRVAGVGTDSWTGARQWDTQNLRPKLVWCSR